MSMQARDLVVPDVALWAMRHRLTLPQAIFVDAYRQDFDPVKALRIAGFAGRNEKALAMKLLNQRNIQAALKFRNEDLRSRAEEMRDSVLEGIQEILEADLSEIYDENNQLKPVTEWPARWRKGLARSVKVYQDPDTKTRSVVKLTIRDRLNYFELLMRHLGMLGPRVKRNEDKKLLAAAQAAQKVNVPGGVLAVAGA